MRHSQIPRLAAGHLPCSHADRPFTTASKTIRGGRTSWTGSMDMPQVRLGPGRFGGPGAVLTGPSVRSQGGHHQPGLPPGTATPAAPRASENRPRHVGPPCACPGRFRPLGMGRTRGARPPAAPLPRRGPTARRSPISGLGRPLSFPCTAHWSPVGPTRQSAHVRFLACQSTWAIGRATGRARRRVGSSWSWSRAMRVFRGT